MNDGVFSRITIVGMIMSLVGGMILFQMARIQSSPQGQQLKEDGTLYYDSRRIVMQPERGNIYDRWGNLLAGNREVYEVGLNLVDIRTPDVIARDLASVLDLKYDEVYAKAMTEYEKGKNEYVIVANFVSPEKIAELEIKKEGYKKLLQDKKNIKKGEYPPSLNGVDWKPHLQRSYPEKTLGANIIGFYSFRDVGGGKPYFGVEEQYNDLLAGTPVEVLYYFDPNKATEIPTVPPGASLLLTIDREIQATVEQILDDAVAGNGAESGTIVVSDPKTGEILAMATTPRLDLNKYWELGDLFSGSTSFNRAIGQTYEPGSVFKVLTMAAAMDAGVVTPETSFLDTGVFSWGGYNIYNWDRGAWGPQTMLGCMQHSLNVCLAWISTTLGPADFYKYMQAFGIGHRTNVDLAGEVNFPLSVPGDPYWADVNLATNSFGQGLAATPLQMVMAVSAIANDGKMMAPHVLKAVIDNDYQRDIQPTIVGRPISAQTARTLTEMLAVSLEEEASNALVEGYRVAGKTGTGEIPGPDGYTTNLTNASFVGWGPVDDPRFVVYVWLEKPTSSPWGSVVASPVFSEVVSKITVLMNLPPDHVRQELYGQ